MRHLNLSVVVAAALLAGTPAAFAGAGFITTAVAPLSDTVTYSTAATSTTPPLNSFIGYTIAIGNGGGNTINNIRFTGTTIVSDAQEAADFDPTATVGATCAATANPVGSPTNARTITCTVGTGQLVAGQSFPTFAVFFKAPVRAVGLLGDAVAFSGTTFYAETNSGSNPLPNSAASWSSSPVVALGTFNPTRVKTAVTKNGGTFFTGSGNGTDKYSTQIVVPTVATYATADITMVDDPVQTNCNGFFNCSKSEIKIPDLTTPVPYAPLQFSLANPLKIVLRQDATNIKPGTKIDSVVITYVSDAGTATIVGLCPTQTLLSTGVPCIAASVYYKNKSVIGWTPALDGDFEWTLLNIKNGIYRIQ